MTTSARLTQYFLRADVVIGPYTVDQLTAREIGIYFFLRVGSVNI